VGSSKLSERIQEALAGFSGRLPLFPLPDVVLLPLAVLPLHVFERRYRAMTRFALDGEKLIGMALLEEGWQQDYHGRPPVHRMVCAGRIIQCAKAADGTYDLLLEGLVRARIVKERQGGEFRLADVEPLLDMTLSPDSEGLWRQRLDMVLIQASSDVSGPIRKLVGTLTASQLPMGPILDLMANALPVDPTRKQEVLAASDVGLRAAKVLELLATCAAAGEAGPSRDSVQ
jgi:Lon protease-like protein